MLFSKVRFSSNIFCHQQPQFEQKSPDFSATKYVEIAPSTPRSLSPDRLFLIAALGCLIEQHERGVHTLSQQKGQADPSSASKSKPTRKCRAKLRLPHRCFAWNLLDCVSVAWPDKRPRAFTQQQITKFLDRVRQLYPDDILRDSIDRPPGPQTCTPPSGCSWKVKS